jgi:SAM-dependent methyltransferase
MTIPTSWTQISRDPNSPQVLSWRQEQLERSRRPPVRRRLDHLKGLATGRVVLDVGVVEHFADNQESDRWLHRHLVEVAASCHGVDILEEDVEVLRSQGFDVEVHDLTQSPMPERFELIVMGEIIEHLGAPQPFLDNVRRSLVDGGRVVLTTPNPYMLNRAWHGVRGRYNDSVDHAVLLGPGNIAELAGRAGLRIDAWRGVQLKDLPGWRNRLVSLTRRALVMAGFAPEIGCDTLIYELVVDAT